MFMTKVTQRISLTQSGKNLIVSETAYDADGFGQSTQAVVPIDPTKDAKEMLAKATRKQWELHGEPNPQGFCQARILGDVPEDATFTTLPSGNSIEVSYEVAVAEEVEQ